MDLQQIKTAFANLAPHEAIYFRNNESWLVMADQLYIRSAGNLIIPVEQADGTLYGSPSDYLLGYTLDCLVVNTIAEAEEHIWALWKWFGESFTGFDVEGNWHENVEIAKVDHINDRVIEFAKGEKGDCFEVYFYLDRWTPSQWGDSQCIANAATIMCREMVSMKQLTDRGMA